MCVALPMNVGAWLMAVMLWLLCTSEMVSIVGERESGHAKLEAGMVWTVWDIYLYI